MNPKNDPENMEEFFDEIDTDDMSSIDDFIKELEAREKDLHISPETVIELEDFDSDSETIDAFMADEFVVDLTLNGNTEPAAQIETVAKPGSNNAALVSKLENEVTKLKGKISKIEDERSELFELSRRRQTDFDNYKKRTERDKTDAFDAQVAGLALGILPVLDNLDRAMISVRTLTREISPDFKQFFDGIALVNNQLKEVLSEMGVEPIRAVGEAFDPHFHEAVATESSKEFGPNIVIDELVRGYLLGSKVIRPSMVKVSTPSNAPAGISPPETE